jgi:hypothetical protein
MKLSNQENICQGPTMCQLSLFTGMGKLNKRHGDGIPVGQELTSTLRFTTIE